MNLNANTKFWLKHQITSYIDRKLNTKQFLRFDMGECTFMINKKAYEAISFITKSDLQEYADPDGKQLKKVIADQHHITTNMITLACGADELIETVPRLFLESGDNTLVITPTFFRFIESSRRLGSNVIEIPTLMENAFAIDEDIVQQVIKQAIKNKVKLIWLCSPNNPTGAQISPNLIFLILKHTKAFVVVDEIFNDLINHSSTDSSINLAKKSKKIIILRSLSKNHGLAGLRIGWGIGHPQTITLLEKWRLPFNISSVSLKLAIAALSNKNHITKVRNFVTKEREFLKKKISQLPNFEIFSGSETIFFLLHHKRKDIFTELLKRNILTADFRQANGLEGKGYVRITIKTRNENSLLLKVLREIE